MNSGLPNGSACVSTRILDHSHQTGCFGKKETNLVFYCAHMIQFLYVVSPFTCVIHERKTNRLFSANTNPLSPVSQHERDIHTMLVHCWPSVADGGPTLYQHWVNVSYLLGTALQSQNTVHDYFCSKQLLPSGFAQQSICLCYQTRESYHLITANTRNYPSDPSDGRIGSMLGQCWTRVTCLVCLVISKVSLSLNMLHSLITVPTVGHLKYQQFCASQN